MAPSETARAKGAIGGNVTIEMTSRLAKETKNGRDEDTDTQRMALLGVVDAEGNDDENEADQRAGRSALKHVEIVPVVHPRLQCLSALPVHYNAVLGERA